MAKKFVKISLATKLRVLFGAAVLGIIAAALIAPWYFMELLAQRGVEGPAAELTRLRLNEYIREHPRDPDAAADDSRSEVVSLYTARGGAEAPKGPSFVPLPPGLPDEALDSPSRRARRAFRKSGDEELAVIEAEDDRGERVYRCFRAVRIDRSCADCHEKSNPALPTQAGQLVGIIDVTVPASAAAGSLVWWTRGAFLVGAALAAALAFFLFVLITQRLILRPVRHLRELSDKVAEGDLSVRSTVQTGDELERLGESFNEMLDATADQHDKLRAANRALDLKLNELAEVNVALYQANQIKNEFLANVSHELRTPLNSILGFADLLADSADERIARYGRNIRTSARNLLGMINDLLDLAKIEAGKTEVRFDSVSVSDTCQGLVTLVRPMADKKQLKVDLEVTGQIPIVRTDGGKLQQILYNLISNAIKFTPAGGKVMVGLSTGDSQREGRIVREVSVSVRDTGPGIPEAEQRHIFDKFYQGDRTLTKETPGTGLGLPIAKELTNLLGGRLTLSSSPGHGTEFILTLPVEPADDASEARPESTATPANPPDDSGSPSTTP